VFYNLGNGCDAVVVIFTQNFYLQDRQLNAFYKDVLERLRKRVQRVRKDNAPAHTALSIRKFLVKKNISTLPHPPYSPDLAPCDFYLFPKLKLKTYVGMDV
jgi:transposase